MSAPALTFRPSTDFSVLPEQPKGGSSFSIQLFGEMLEGKPTGNRWIGKCEREAALRPDVLANQRAESNRWRVAAKKALDPERPLIIQNTKKG